MKNDNEQIIKTMAEYAKAHNVELRLLDEDKVKEIIKIGCKEYLENKNDFISKDKIREYVNSPEFLDWHLGFTLLDELEYRKNNINELLEE